MTDRAELIEMVARLGKERDEFRSQMIAQIEECKESVKILCAAYEIRNNEMLNLLRECKHKLALYRANHSGEYLGGMEYTRLVAAIDTAMTTSPSAQASETHTK